MNKFSFLFMFLLLAQFVIAGNQKIVVRLTDKGTKHKTEVKVDKDGEGGTIIVNPDDATITITITIKDIDGTVLVSDMIPAMVNGVYEVMTPVTEGNHIIEVKDDNGIVYSDIE